MQYFNSVAETESRISAALFWFDTRGVSVIPVVVLMTPNFGAVGAIPQFAVLRLRTSAALFGSILAVFQLSLW